MGTKRYYKRDHFLSGAAEADAWSRGDYDRSPTPVVLSSQNGPNRAARRRARRVLGFTPNGDNEPYRKAED